MDSKGENSAADDPTVRAGLSRKDIFDLVRNKLNDGAAAAYEKIENAMSEKLQRPFTLSHNMKSVIRNLLSKLNEKWQIVSRHEDKFLKNFSDWLNVFVPLEESPKSLRRSRYNIARSSLEFSETSKRAKRRKTGESSYVSQLNLRASDKLNAAKVIQDTTLGIPSKAKQCRESIRSTSETPLSPDEALSILVQTNLSKSQYQKIRDGSRENSCTLFPPYNKVRQAKLKCYPAESDISVTECSAEVKLQALLDHTIERILLTQTDVIRSMSHEKIRNLTLVCKWGCDGPSGQSKLKEKITADDGSKCDADIFVTSLVPLQLLSIDQETHDTVIVWKNPRPSSPRFCRPIRIRFLHENTEVIVNEMDFIKQQESKLIPYETVVNAKIVGVSFKLVFTMADDKVCDAISDTASAQRCYLCKAASKDFNNIDAMLKRKIDEDRSEFSLSTLNVWIRFFECCLHIGYNLDIKKSHVSDSNNKEGLKKRRECIQKGFRLRLGLIVDQPKLGSSSLIDGNTARQFFQRSTISASITGVDEDLIKRFHVILQALSSGHEINLLRFQDYTLQTARDFVNLYPWYHMPSTVHKVLIHGAEIINSALLPIGQMSEYARESSNKYVKKFRTDFSSKCSRVKNMEDLLSRCLLTSDPYISCLRKLPCKKLKSLLPEAAQLLTAPSISISEGSWSYFLGDSTDSESGDSSSDDDYDNYA